MVAHARECAVCSQFVAERTWQEAWLRERFEKASEQVLSKAPSFSEATLRNCTEQSAHRIFVFGPMAAAAILIATAIGWWQWPGSSPEPMRSVARGHLRTQESRERTTDSVLPTSHPKMVESPRHSTTRPDLTPFTGSVVLTSPTLTATVAPATQDFSSSAGSGVAMAHTFNLTPTAIAPDATGYLSTISPYDSANQDAAMIALSLSGLEPEAMFYVRTRDIDGQEVWLASLRTDTTGSGVVMLRTGPTLQGRRPAATPARSALPTASSGSTARPDGDPGSRPGEDFDVVDDDGNIVGTVSTRPKVASPLQPTPKPTPTH
jgi:hypothetical protein